MSYKKILAFDPTFIPKSGNNTSGVGYFWSGYASRAERGLEFGGIAAICISMNLCLIYFFTSLGFAQTVVLINKPNLNYYS
ncbi:hypothetical protein [Aureispira anguillae]|uniref:Uncharacterized protein n=1 Tax=Aureispira anguillae TaxID=2864201 RepID=A0A915YJJ5_9BACT|nr:hypothetical protein [Aureispira anguillae]BDS14390.1 hypothetical protein AsAng_0051690 [Aureispira anguillae]